MTGSAYASPQYVQPITDQVYGNTDAAHPREASHGKAPGGFSVDTNRGMSPQEATDMASMMPIASLASPRHSAFFWVVLALVLAYILNRGKRKRRKK